MSRTSRPHPASAGRHRRAAVAACLTLALGACAATTAGRGNSEAAAGRQMTAGQYAEFQQAIRGDPEIRARVNNDCARETAAQSSRERAAMAAMLDVDADEVGRVFCERWTDSVARGDISYDDFVSFRRSDGDAEALRRVVRALRQPAGELMV